jgi:hypothetical protein
MIIICSRRASRLFAENDTVAGGADDWIVLTQRHAIA